MLVKNLRWRTTIQHRHYSPTNRPSNYVEYFRKLIKLYKMWWVIHYGSYDLWWMDVGWARTSKTAFFTINVTWTGRIIWYQFARESELFTTCAVEINISSIAVVNGGKASRGSVNGGNRYGCGFGCADRGFQPDGRTRPWRERRRVCPRICGLFNHL